jgi:hypothetical protein
MYFDIISDKFLMKYTYRGGFSIVSAVGVGIKILKRVGVIRCNIEYE